MDIFPFNVIAKYFNNMLNPIAASIAAKAIRIRLIASPVDSSIINEFLIQRRFIAKKIISKLTRKNRKLFFLKINIAILKSMIIIIIDMVVF